MSERIEIEIREALEAEAAQVEVPEDLARRTIEAAEELGKPTWRERFRAWRDARTVGGRVTGYPRWVYAGATATVMLLLWGVGYVVTEPPRSETVAGDVREAGPAQEGPQFMSGVQGSPERVTPMSGAAEVEQFDVEDRAIGIPVPPPEPGRPGAFPPQLVRTTELEVEIRRGGFDRAWAEANEIASRHEGFVTSSRTETVRDRFARGHVTVRVPGERLEAALRDFRRLGTLVRMGSSGFDVSGQFVDLDARIRALQAQETQLLELMRQARNVSETLEIRTRLDSVRTEIEQLQAQRESLQGQVDYATIQATVYEPDGAPAPGGDGRFDDAWRTALETALQIFAGLIVVMGFLVPFALIGFVLWLGVRLVRRRSV